MFLEGALILESGVVQLENAKGYATLINNEGIWTLDVVFTGLATARLNIQPTLQPMLPDVTVGDFQLVQGCTGSEENGNVRTDRYHFLPIPEAVGEAHAIQETWPVSPITVDHAYVNAYVNGKLDGYSEYAGWGAFFDFEGYLRPSSNKNALLGFMLSWGVPQEPSFGARERQHRTTYPHHVNTVLHGQSNIFAILIRQSQLTINQIQYHFFNRIHKKTWVSSLYSTLTWLVGFQQTDFTLAAITSQAAQDSRVPQHRFWRWHQICAKLSLHFQKQPCVLMN